MEEVGGGCVGCVVCVVSVLLVVPLGDCEGDEGRVGVGDGGRVGGSVGSSSSIPVEKEKGYVTFGAEHVISKPHMHTASVCNFKPQMVLITILVRCCLATNFLNLNNMKY